MSVLEQVCQIVFRFHMSCHHCCGLKFVRVSSFHEILCNLPDNPLEGNLADKEVGELLQAPNPAEGNSAGTIAKGLPCAGSLFGPFLAVPFKVLALACFRLGAPSLAFSAAILLRDATTSSKGADAGARCLLGALSAMVVLPTLFRAIGKSLFVTIPATAATTTRRQGKGQSRGDPQR